MKRKKITYYFCMLLLMLSLVGYSQGKSNPPRPKPNGPIYPELPIDGGLTYLLIAGITFGVYQIKRKKA